jgi:hypothetical protein
MAGRTVGLPTESGALSVAPDEFDSTSTERVELLLVEVSRHVHGSVSREQAEHTGFCSSHRTLRFRHVEQPGHVS